MSKFETIEMSVCDTRNIPEAELFASNSWLQNISQYGNLKLHGLQDRDRNLVAFWGREESRKYGIKLLRTPRFSPAIPFWVSAGNYNSSSRNSRIKKVMAAFAEDLIEAGGIVSMALPVGILDTQPLTWNGFKVIVRYTYRLFLDKPEIEIVAGYASKRRNEISRAKRNGIEVCVSNNLEPAYSLICASLDRKTPGFDARRVYDIMNRFIKIGQYICCIAIDKEGPVAASFCVHDQHVAYYLLGGFNKEADSIGAAPLTLHQCILEAKKKGLSIFDFEGSMVPEIEFYFRTFGGSLTPYFVANRASLPLEIGLKLLRRSEF